MGWLPRLHEVRLVWPVVDPLESWAGPWGLFRLPSQNRKNVLPISPNAPIAIGINEKFASMISPMTSSAESGVLLVISLVPPVM